jgi:hypothetical protein
MLGFFSLKRFFFGVSCVREKFNGYQTDIHVNDLFFFSPRRCDFSCKFMLSFVWFSETIYVSRKEKKKAAGGVNHYQRNPSPAVCGLSSDITRYQGFRGLVFPKFCDYRDIFRPKGHH